MKNSLFLTLTTLLGCLLFGCAGAPTRQATVDSRPPRLQLTVGVPPSMSIIRDEEISEAFAYRVSAILKEQGFRGRIRYVEEYEAPMAGVPVLELELREWRVDRAGFVNCTFTAELKGANGSQRLGIFSGTSIMTWSRRDWFSRMDGFEDAASDAISTLASRLEQSGYIDRPSSR